MDNPNLSVSRTYYQGQNKDVYLENQLNKKPRNRKYKKDSHIVMGNEKFDLETLKQNFEKHHSIDERFSTK